MADTAGELAEAGLVGLILDIDTMRDVYMSQAQRAAFDRIVAAAQAPVHGVPVLWVHKDKLRHAVACANLPRPESCDVRTRNFNASADHVPLFTRASEHGGGGEAVAWPKVWGVGRMFDNENALLVIFDRKPTDDELRAFDDFAKGSNTPPTPSAPDKTFAEWLASEMPAGTVIGDPAWWADRIARQYAKRCTPPSAPVVGDGGLSRSLKLAAAEEQAEAWQAVCGLLSELSPGWASVPRKGVDAALDAIRALSGVSAPVGVEGVALIAAERRRQIEVEGWTPEHDAEHRPGELARAGAAYALAAGSYGVMRERCKQTPGHDLWPWESEWWKPGPDDSNASRVREMVKAGALIAAEIDRMQALTPPAAAPRVEDPDRVSGEHVQNLVEFARNAPRTYRDHDEPPPTDFTTPAASEDGLQAIIADIRHSAKADDYEPQQIAWLESIADRLAASGQGVELIDHYQQFVDEAWFARRRPDDNQLRNLYIMSVGIGGESGEVQELLKKYVRDGVLDVDDLVLELGDVAYYAARIASWFGRSLREVLEANKKKLIERQRQGKRGAAASTQEKAGG